MGLEPLLTINTSLCANCFSIKECGLQGTITFSLFVIYLIYGFHVYSLNYSYLNFREQIIHLFVSVFDLS